MVVPGPAVIMPCAARMRRASLRIMRNLDGTDLRLLGALAQDPRRTVVALAQKLGLSGSFWSWVESLDINTLGFVIVGLFVVVWAVAVTVWRLGRIEERWSARLRPVETPE